MADRDDDEDYMTTTQFSPVITTIDHWYSADWCIGADGDRYRRAPKKPGILLSGRRAVSFHRVCTTARGSSAFLKVIYE